MNKKVFGLAALLILCTLRGGRYLGEPYSYAR